MSLQFLEHAFDETTFREFVQKSFEEYEEIESRFKTDALSEADKEHVKAYKYMGEAFFSDDTEIGILLLKSQDKNVENKRVGFSKVINKLSKPIGKDTVLVAIYHGESSVWRLTFVSYTFKDGKQTQKTDSKRYTYVLGKDIPVKTAREQLGVLLEGSITQSSMEEAFSVEKVGREFFTKYKELYFKTCDYLEPQKAIFQDDKTLELFTKKLLGRIVFLYFLQKKGWLGSQGEWSNGDKKFLTNAFNGNYKTYNNFYADVLQTIFFDALNRDREEQEYVFEPFGKMPYLNGGLFSVDEIDKDKRLIIEDEIFENIFNVFDQYNFTIIEDTPHDSEVAIDPEMLGRVFEELLPDRKEKGAFYTPREIVHYMCQESIINYLMNSYKEHDDEIKAFVRHKEMGSLEKKKLKESLESIKVVDPAIGSGAFPMGMLHEIVSLLEIVNDDKNKNLKRDVIQNSIYGVDIEPSAVEIAKLRFWLSIVVDEVEPSPLPNLFYKIMVGNSLLETVNGLDLLEKQEKKISKSKLRQMNNQTADDINFLLQEKLHKYFNEHDIGKKQSLDKDIKAHILDILGKSREKLDVSVSLLDETKKEIKQREANIEKRMLLDTVIQDYKLHNYSTELFLYRLYFKDVMDKGGFDIVIGNPPYVRHEKIRAIKERLKIEGYKSYNGTADLYIYFFEQALRLLKENGILSYITSNTYVNARYAEKFREFIVDGVNVLSYVDFSKVQLFDTATVATSIFVLNKNSQKNQYFKYCDAKRYKKGEDLEKFVSKNKFDYLQDDLRKEGFIFTSREELEIKKIIDKKGKKLKSKDWGIQIKSGIKTGFNEAFIIDEEKKNELIQKDPKSAKIIKPLLRGRDVKRYEYEFAGKWLINSHNNPPIHMNEYPIIKGHLDKYYDRLEKRSDKGVTPYNLRNCAYLDDFTKNKIIWLELSDDSKFTFDVKNNFLEMTVFFMVGEDLKYLLALLNSKLIYWCFNLICAESGVGTNRWKKIYVEQLPIPKISKEAQKPFEILVDYILFSKENNLNLEASYFESLIDGLVYDLYFEDEMKKHDYYTTDEVTKIVEAFDNSIEMIEKMYKLFKNSKIVQRSLVYRGLVKEIKIINGVER